MNVTSATTGLYATLLGKSSGSTTASSSTAEAASTSASTSSLGSSTSTVDFTHMTRQQLSDWVSGQVKSGQMSVKDSIPFFSLTFKFDQATGQQVDMSTDTTTYNFLNVAQNAVAGAQSMHNDVAAAALQNALTIMQNVQDASAGVDITV